MSYQIRKCISITCEQNAAINNIKISEINKRGIAIHESDLVREMIDFYIQNYPTKSIEYTDSSDVADVHSMADVNDGNNVNNMSDAADVSDINDVRGVRPEGTLSNYLYMAISKGEAIDIGDVAKLFGTNNNVVSVMKCRIKKKKLQICG